MKRATALRFPPWIAALTVMMSAHCTPPTPGPPRPGELPRVTPRVGGEDLRARPGPNNPRPTDASVAVRVRRVLVQDRWIDARRVRLRVSRGVVELTGEAPNERARRRAARLALTVRGVEAVINRLARAVPTTSTGALEKAVDAALDRVLGANAKYVQRSVQKHRVRLTGKVGSYALARRLRFALLGIPGIHRVVLALRVPLLRQRSDAALKRDVARQLATDPYLAHTRLQVRVRQGWVTIRGQVSTDGARIRARTQAWLAGVRGVDIRGLTVESRRASATRRGRPPLRSDTQIADLLARVLELDPRLRGHPVRTSVDFGVVTLHGRVLSEQARKAVRENVRQVAGVVSVRGSLRVGEKGGEGRQPPQ